MMLYSPTLPSLAQDDRPSQAGINALVIRLSDDFGVNPAFPGEWQASSASEVQQLYEGLTVIYQGFDIVANCLYQLDGSPQNLTPFAHFRLHFDNANITYDRTTRIGDYAGNTAPQRENGEVVGYMIQFSPLGMSQPFTLAHEMGHIVDALLNDVPHQEHVMALGGVVGTLGWIPGRGYQGNELLFPRAVGGANEDFADTFGQMMMGNLSLFDSTAPRWLFMTTRTHRWLDAIGALAQTTP